MLLQKIKSGNTARAWQLTLPGGAPAFALAA